MKTVLPNADFVIESYVDPTEPLRDEGSFGDHTGYGLAGFTFNGRPLVYFGGWENHYALYAASPAVQKKFAKKLKGFVVSKGTIRFTSDTPLPVALVEKLVKSRIAENNG